MSFFDLLLLNTISSWHLKSSLLQVWSFEYYELDTLWCVEGWGQGVDREEVRVWMNVINKTLLGIHMYSLLIRQQQLIWDK